MADATRSKRAKLNYDDYLTLPDDRNRYEILEGDLNVSPSPTLDHQEVSRNLEFLIFSHVKSNDAGKILDAPVDVILDENTIVQPDLVFVSRERNNICAKWGIEGAPDLIVEIISPGSMRYDRIKKFGTYAKYGVLWYWMVNPDELTVEEYVLENDSYKLAGSCAGKGIFKPGVFPGLEIDLSEVWP